MSLDTLILEWEKVFMLSCFGCVPGKGDTDSHLQCYCGNTLSSGSRRVSDDVCSLVCMGNFESICGGANSLSLYQADQSNIAVS